MCSCCLNCHVAVLMVVGVACVCCVMFEVVSAVVASDVVCLCMMVCVWC